MVDIELPPCAWRNNKLQLTGSAEPLLAALKTAELWVARAAQQVLN